MKKDQIIILEKRGVVLISGYDAKDFLQNVITNDIKKVKENNSIFSAILTPQGKYLIEFFVIYHDIPKLEPLRTASFILSASSPSTKSCDITLPDILTVTPAEPV